MSYQSLLFCNDEKTARVVTKVLNELDFSVEPCSEPFAAVKRLTTGHYDALVVDCEDEQNATLLFKTARNSTSNHSSLAVALVEGQGGIAKAFRLGANLVLTKPINAEQSKGTLRVARGLLRKAESAKPAAVAPPSQESPALFAAENPELLHPLDQVSLTPNPAFAPVPAKTDLPPAPLASAALEVEEEDPTPELGPAEAALLESMADAVPAQPTQPAVSAPIPKTYPWQPVKRKSSELVSGAQLEISAADETTKAVGQDASASFDVAGLTEAAEAKAGLRSSSRAFSGDGTGTATAPSKDVSPAAEDVFATTAIDAPRATAPPKTKSVGGSKSRSAVRKTSSKAAAAEDASGFSWSGAAKDREASEEVQSKSNFLLATLLVLCLAAIGYLGWPRLQPTVMSLPLVQKYLGQRQPQTAVGIQASTPALPPAPTPAPAETVPPSSPEQQPAAAASAGAPPQVTPENATPVQPETPAQQTEPPAPATSSAGGTAHARRMEKAQAPIVVKSDTNSHLAKAQQAVPPPLAVGTADSNDKTIAGIVSATPANTHKPVLQAVHVSQSVSEGLLLKRITPVYPTLAQQMHVEGAVQLQANISKEGNITSIKVLSGDPLLTRAAVDAVRQWKYKPYQLDGQPLEIQTPITVNFNLP